MPLMGTLLSLPQKCSKGRLHRDPQPTWVVTLVVMSSTGLPPLLKRTPLVRRDAEAPPAAVGDCCRPPGLGGSNLAW
jgi:hypothetical protein